MYNPYLAELLPFNSFVTIHWELNKFSHEQVKEHHDFILPSTTIGYLWFTHSATSPMMWRLLPCLELNRLKSWEKKIIPLFIEKQCAIS